MTLITIDYTGKLRCVVIHADSNVKMITDAPKDNMGEGSSFSPTDLIGTALASCILTTMAIGARTQNLELSEMKATVEKTMSTDKPRRITNLKVVIDMGLPSDHPQRGYLEKIAKNCPVHHSLHSDMKQDIVFKWQN